MMNTNFQSLWIILKENKFKFDSEIPGYLKCSKCQQILINACNTPCGCRFCFDCIETYLGNKERSCPGGKENCIGQLISLEKHIQIDHPINHEISKLVVICIEPFCGFRDELRNLENHHKVCKNRHYSVAGSFESDSMEVSMNEDHNSRFNVNLFIGWIENLGNEIAIMKQDIIELKMENKHLRAKLDTKLDRGDEVAISEFQDSTSVNLKLNEAHFFPDNDVNKGIANLEKDSVMDHTKGLEKPLSPTNPLANNNVKFLWKIDKFSQKRKYAQYWFNTELISEPFFSHMTGYKLHLLVYPNGFGAGNNTHLSALFSIMRGEHDNRLLWPMTSDITIALIDQKTGAIHTSYKYNLLSTPDNLKYVFQRPEGRENRSFGTSKFIKIDDLVKNPALLNNDTITLICIVNIPS